ncbi:type II toxin-antitoxin system RatA family toxin [Alphaproteobacteria bacterium]|jgi:coenzyme Q-binding protein COQ10|nr:type II toxin-antitoxin system RatA family toxin [Alphaproteobacteria bacterium]
MKPIKLTRVSPFSASQMFDMVADVSNYPEFLPYCVGARVHETNPSPTGSGAVSGIASMKADLMIRYKFIHESYTSLVHLNSNDQSIEVNQAHGPFRKLSNKWHFEPRADGGCDVHFFLDFEFAVPLLRRVLSPLMERATRHMVEAFEARAVSLYSEPDAD